MNRLAQIGRELLLPARSGVVVLAVVFALVATATSHGAVTPPGPCQTLQQMLAHLQRFNSGRVLSMFWLEAHPGVKVGEQFDATPLAQYSVIKRPLAWTENCVLQSFEGGPVATRVPLDLPYTMRVERRLQGETQWTAVSTTRKSPGERVLMSFSEQGEYRLTAALVDPGSASPCGPIAAYHIVVDCIDPSLTRGRGIIGIDVQLPRPFSGTGMTISGGSQPGGCRPVPFMATVREGAIDWESGGSQMARDVGEPRPYPRPVWVLLERDRELERTRGSVYTFDPARYGDGQYDLEAHLDEADQPKSIRSFRTRPSRKSITVHGCGERSPEVEKTPSEEAGEKAVAGQKRLEEIRLIDPEDRVDGGWVEVIKPDKFFPDGKRASDTPRVPIDLAAICEKLAAEIARRRRQYGVPCAVPLNLMLALYRAPKTFNDLEVEQGKAWNGVAAGVREFAKPFVKMEAEFLALLNDAVAADLLVPRVVQEKEKRQGPGGRPPLMGDEIPLAMFEFSPKKLALKEKLEARKKLLFEKWAAARRDALAKVAELDAKAEAAAEAIERIHADLERLAAAHAAVKAKLADLFYSGKYEHCLGLGQSVTRGFIPADGAHTALPGMEILLPVPKRLPVRDLIPRVPAPLHLQELEPPYAAFVPLRFKYDGAKWLQSERKLLEALAAAKQKEFMGKVATFILYANPLSNIGLTAAGDAEFRAAWLSAWKTVSQDVPAGLARTDEFLDKVLGTDLSGKLSPEEKLKAVDLIRGMNKLPWMALEGFFTSAADSSVALVQGAYDFNGLGRLMGDPDFLTQSRELGNSPQETVQAIAMLKDELKAQEKFGEARVAGAQLALELLLSKIGASIVGKLATKTEAALKEGMGLVLKKLDDAAAAIARPVANKLDDITAWAMRARQAKEAGLTIGEGADDFIRAADKLEDATEDLGRSTQRLREVRQAQETRVLEEMKRTGRTDRDAVLRELEQKDDAFRAAARQEDELAGRVAKEKQAVDEAATEAGKLKEQALEQGDEASRILEREKARVKHQLDKANEEKLEKAIQEQRAALKEKPADWPKGERWPPIMSAGVIDEATGEVVTGFAGNRSFKDFKSKLLRDLEDEFNSLEKTVRNNAVPDDTTVPRQKPGVCAEFMAIDQWLTNNPGKDPSSLVMRARYTKGNDIKPACRWCRWLAFRLKIKLLE